MKFVLSTLGTVLDIAVSSITLGGYLLPGSSKPPPKSYELPGDVVALVEAIAKEQERVPEYIVRKAVEIYISKYFKEREAK